jgi:hypothetical protein
MSHNNDHDENGTSLENILMFHIDDKDDYATSLDSLSMCNNID